MTRRSAGVSPAAIGRPASDRPPHQPAAAAPIALLFCFLASTLLAQSVAVTQTGTIVAAHDGVVDLYDAEAKSRIWRAAGVPHSGAIAIGEKDVAVLDPLDNRATIVDLETGTPRQVRTGETPVGAAFAGRDLCVLDRDARIVERIDPSGLARATVAVEADPAFLAFANGKLYVYSRMAGALQEITLAPFAASRSTPVPPFASGLVADERTAYLVYPEDQRHFDISRIKSSSIREPRMTTSGGVVAVDLASMQATDQTASGSAPVGICLITRSFPTAVPTLLVADPAGRRVLMIEGRLSPEKAFARGFVKGLIGTGSASATTVPFPTGVDRLSAKGNSWLAYDSSSSTLYRFSNRESSVLAHGLGPNAFAAIPGGAAWWQNGTLVAQRENR